jgi:hypothetical protein
MLKWPAPRPRNVICLAVILLAALQPTPALKRAANSNHQIRREDPIEPSAGAATLSMRKTQASTPEGTRTTVEFESSRTYRLDSIYRLTFRMPDRKRSRRFGPRLVCDRSSCRCVARCKYRFGMRSALLLRLCRQRNGSAPLGRHRTTPKLNLVRLWGCRHRTSPVVHSRCAPERSVARRSCVAGPRPHRSEESASRLPSLVEL